MRRVLALIACLGCPAAGSAHPDHTDGVISIGGLSVTISVGLKIEPTEEKPAAKKPARRKQVSKPRKAKPKPKQVVYDLAGTWDWVAQCKVWGRIEGVSVYEKKGANAYIGAAKSKGIAAQTKLDVTVSGREFVQKERLGLIRATGKHRFSANGRRFEGSVNNGCTVVANKR